MLVSMWMRTGRPAHVQWTGMLCAALVLLTLASGCQHQPRARPVVAPDGAPAIHVSCGSDQGACFELAGQYCPNGYRLKPIFDVESNNFLVRCREDVAIQAPSTPSTVVVRSLGPGVPHEPEAPSTWPPPPQPWPGADPWPAAAAGAPQSSAPLPETARLPDGQIDIGY